MRIVDIEPTLDHLKEVLSRTKPGAVADTIGLIVMMLTTLPEIEQENRKEEENGESV